MTTRITDVERVCKALADVTRLRILNLLLAGEVCVCHIHQALKISQPKTSRHLAYLRRAGLVDARREGLWMHYQLAEVADPILQTIRDAAVHALTHLDAARRDTDRLQKATGCGVPLAAAVTSMRPCCADAGTAAAARS